MDGLQIDPAAAAKMTQRDAVDVFHRGIEDWKLSPACVARLKTWSDLFDRRVFAMADAQNGHDFPLGDTICRRCGATFEAVCNDLVTSCVRPRAADDMNTIRANMERIKREKE